MSITERFWKKVDRRSGGCWLWLAQITSDGYGRFRLGDRMVRAHRWAYEDVVGPIPKGLTIDHLCRNRACVNPAHLEPVTNRVNLLRGASFVAVNARKTRCDHGHEFTDTNTYTYQQGGSHRHCRLCSGLAVQRYQANHRAQGLCLKDSRPAAPGHVLCQHHLNVLHHHTRKAAV